ncbi:MAG: immunity 17 family protein [Bacteroides sp.]|nr:immunity 17 family protein [Bacteroides sp.]
MTNDNYAMKVTDIYEWLAGLLFRWKWACEWQFHGKLWFFDDCKPETRRRIKIVLVSVLIILILVDFFVWR